MKVFIYALTDEQNRVRYVGQSVDPHFRYQRHLQDMTGSPKSEWIQSVIKAGGAPGLVLLDKVDKADANYQEKWWITLGRKRGWDLTNVANPSANPVSFQDMFLETLKDELTQFSAEHDPVLMITRRHIQTVATVTKIVVGLLLGAAMGYAGYSAEFRATGVAPIALFYGFVSFTFTAHLFFLWGMGVLPDLGAKKFIAMHVAPLLLVWGSRSWDWFS